MTWTEERRKKQADSIRKHKPWLKSTGPKSRAGKQSSSLNALKNGWRSCAGPHLLALMRINREFRRHCELYYLADALEIRKTNELIEDRLKSNAEAEKIKN